MRIVFCWSAPSGYMAACWKAMHRRPGADLFVLAHGSASAAGGFSQSVLEGLRYRMLPPEEKDDAGLVERLVAEQRPDVVAFTGWWLRPYRDLLKSRRLRGVRFVMGVDRPWRHELQYLTRLRYGRLLARLDHVFVTGERSWQYMRRLGVPAGKISRGMYGVDTQLWATSLAERLRHPWPRRFLFLGRYAREKAIDTLVTANRLYRESVSDPWPLVCCGKGPLAHLLEGQPGIENRGFIQPADLPELAAKCGAFVMPSRFDPWPLALVEAAASGLPIVCTDACGSSVEVVRDAYNGFVVPTDSPEELARAMASVSERGDGLPEWGARSAALSACYGAEIWSDRWMTRFARLLDEPGATAT